jgi:L-cystine transport system substrate-binding protein
MLNCKERAAKHFAIVPARKFIEGEKKMKALGIRKLLCLVLMVVLLSACTGGGNETATNDVSTGETVVKVGTMGTYFPFSYTNDEGSLTGYDVEVVRLLDERMKDYSIEFQTGDLISLFLEMDAGRVMMVANQIAKNPEREEKYLFSDDGYIYVQTHLVVNGDDNTRTTMADFEGETMGALNGDYFAELIEAYHAENGEPFEIRYYDGEYEPIFIDMDAGRVQGTLNDATVVNGYAKEMGLNIKCVGEALESSFSYHCIRSDAEGQAFKASVDAALKEVIADGSLAALCVEWFGEDFVNAG